MINASKKIQEAGAAFSVGPCVRSLAVCCILGGSAGTALAGPGSHDGGMGQASRAEMRLQVQQAQDWPRGGGQLDQRQPDPRSFEGRAENQRSAYNVREQEQGQTQTQADSGRRANNGRMTADQRRDLRRQINEAGKDLYDRPPRR